MGAHYSTKNGLRCHELATPALSGTHASRPVADYMIAVGGAGSSGLPAFANGILIMTVISTASATMAAISGGLAKTTGMEWPVPTTDATTNPHNASPAIRPEAVS